MQQRLEYLDGLRGLAAFWVIIGHVMHRFDWNVPLLSSPSYAVDLFMLISGFLMYYHAKMRQTQEPFEQPQSWLIFWTRRFFRIAPLYYFVLAITFIVSPHFLPLLDGFAQVGFFPERYLDHSWQNILAHATFTFGFMPQYHILTALPDWSIGLEMQFYMLFPFMVLLMHKYGHIKTSITLCATSVLLWLFAYDYMHSFLLPTFIALKINVFLAGMLIAAAMSCEQKKIIWYFVLALALAGLPLAHIFGIPSTVFRILLTAGLAVLALHHRFNLPRHISALIDRLSQILGRGIFFFMGEMSYAVYLIHVLVLIPVGGYLWINHRDDYPTQILALFCMLIVAGITYPLSYLLHIMIEKPGIALGKKLIKKMKENTPS